MNYWPTQSPPDAGHRTYLFISTTGVGALTVPRAEAPAALLRLRQGEMPAGAELIPANHLMRVESYKEDTLLIARLTQGKSLRFNLRTVAARNEAMLTLRDHPAVKESTMNPQPLKDRINPRLAICAALSALTWIAYEVLAAGQEAGQQIAESSLGLFTYIPFVVLPITVGLGAILALVYSLWQSHRNPPQLEEVLFM